MFKLRLIETGEIYTVYDVVEKDNTYGNQLYVLVFMCNKWRYMQMDLFEPIKEN